MRESAAVDVIRLLLLSLILTVCVRPSFDCPPLLLSRYYYNGSSFSTYVALQCVRGGVSSSKVEIASGGFGLVIV